MTDDRGRMSAVIIEEGDEVGYPDKFRRASLLQPSLMEPIDDSRTDGSGNACAGEADSKPGLVRRTLFSGGKKGEC